MSTDPTVLPPDAPLMDAAIEMLRHKLGSIIVADEGRVVGVFTTIDALRALMTVLGERVSKSKTG